MRAHKDGLQDVFVRNRAGLLTRLLFSAFPTPFSVQAPGTGRGGERARDAERKGDHRPAQRDRAARSAQQSTQRLQSDTGSCLGSGGVCFDLLGAGAATAPQSGFALCRKRALLTAVSAERVRTDGFCSARSLGLTGATRGLALSSAVCVDFLGHHDEEP